MTLAPSKQSIFESFNARNLSPQQVAQRFIPPPRHFSDLTSRRHSVVIGPRGSGKTTLLKMLQLPALAAWKHADAEGFRQSIDFTGVFIAADVSWGAQLASIGLGKLPPEAISQLSLSAFTSHVLIALIGAMRECASAPENDSPALEEKYVNLSKAQESELCSLIADNWRLSVPIKSFNALKLALRSRLTDISTICGREAAFGPEGAMERISKLEFLFLGFIECCTFAIEAFNDVVNQSHRKWAFLFDELEIAPPLIRQTLFNALRSTDARILFKLSISPYHEDAKLLTGGASAMPGQDYQPIELWYPRKEQGYVFSESLLASMLDEAGLTDRSPYDVFGPSPFDAGDVDDDLGGTAYRPGTSTYRRFRDLYSRDPSFRNYIDAHNINIDEMHLLDDKIRASVIRKGTSVVAVRDYYKSSNFLTGAPTRTGRSRKAATLYTGVSSLFAIIEGNPRWFIGIMGPMIHEYKIHERKVTSRFQAKSIFTATNRFRALLRTIPFNSKEISSSRGLIALLDAIGQAFHDNLVDGEFNPDPPLSFVVDSTASQEVLDALGKALNAGAIIIVPDHDGDAIASSLRGKRFRLSYMLAPGYGIPLTLGRQIALSHVLSRGNKAAGQLNLLEQNA